MDKQKSKNNNFCKESVLSGPGTSSYEQAKNS